MQNERIFLKIMVIIIILSLLSIISTGCFSDDGREEEIKDDVLCIVSGTVTDKLTNAPISEATVIAYTHELSRKGFASAKTSSDGTFEILFPDSEDYMITDDHILFNLYVSADGYILTPFSNKINSNFANFGADFKFELQKEITNCNIALSPSGSVKINIKSENTSQPLSRVTVLLESVNEPHGIEGTNNTDSLGSCSISEIPAGIYNLIVTKGGYITQVVRNVTVKHEKVIEIDDIYLFDNQDYTRVYGGNQSQPNSKIIQNGPFVTAYHKDTSSIAAACMFTGNWHYELGLLPGNYIFKACGIGYATSQKMINITDIDSYKNDIYLEPLP